LGFGTKNFDAEIQWCKDPLSGFVWPRDYHREISLIRNDGSDARALWEVNRLGHLITLAHAYVVSGNEDFSKECVEQLRSWAEQNPYGRGVNWTCAMEVALRAMNLLAVFELTRTSAHLDRQTLELFLKLFHQHGTYIMNNLEFSYISTSNHYLSDLAGLVWLGIMLPEFRESENWREFGLTRLLREMDKQVLLDGADFESSTGYHRFVLELFLYTFILCKENSIDIGAHYWQKLRAMLEYVRGYLRPDGLAPLIGDSDSGRVLPCHRRSADEHAYVLTIGAAALGDAKLRTRSLDSCPELLWLLGGKGIETFQSLNWDVDQGSQGFPNAGTYIMRHEDLYLCLNVSDAGLNGRGSHGHNDALSIEVCVGTQPFIVDPGTYVYTADLNQRHLFRSTLYHSTVTVDGEEQNTTLKSVPFVIGNEAKPRVVSWATNADSDRVVAEHFGYRRLSSPIVHRRTIELNKWEHYWLIEDEFSGDGEHLCEVRFHFAPGLGVAVEDYSVKAINSETGVALSVTSLDLKIAPVLEEQACSRDYGEKRTSVTACWTLSGQLRRLRWKMTPIKLS
jgi:Heparinase II/III N-terminus/Heparinase II/III-like protein